MSGIIGAFEAWTDGLAGRRVIDRELAPCHAHPRAVRQHVAERDRATVPGVNRPVRHLERRRAQAQHRRRENVHPRIVREQKFGDVTPAHM